MTSPVKARHRKAARPLTPLNGIAPNARRGLAVAATSGLALSMLVSGAQATSQDAQNLSKSAGTLKTGLSAQVEKLATQNSAVQVSTEVTDTDVAAVAQVSAQAPQEEAAAPSTGDALIEYGKQLIGTPYVWGASGPNAFDCSGFVAYVYASIGVTLPHQSSAIRNMAGATVVSADQAQPGDIMWWPGHVAIYAGDGMLLEAVEGSGVHYASVWGSPTYLHLSDLA